MKTDSEFLSPLLVQEQFLNTLLSYISEFYSPSLLYTLHKLEGSAASLEKEMAAHSSVLAWRIPGTGQPDELPSVGLRRVGHD